MSISIDMTGIDWKLLAKQKKDLMTLARVVEVSGMRDVLKEEIESVEGIVNLIDHIQDEAALQIGATEVFPNEELE